MRSSPLALSLFLFAASSSACEPPRDPPRPPQHKLADEEEDHGPIPIGECASFESAERERALAFHRGLVLALESANAHGGVDGHPLELRTLDDRGRPGEARRAVERFRAQNDVVALAGGTSCATARAIAAAAQGLVFVSPCDQLERGAGVLPLAAAEMDARLAALWNEHYGADSLTSEAGLGWRAGTILIDALEHAPSLAAKDLAASLARVH